MKDKLKVLIADDHRLARQVIRKMLADLRKGIEVEEVEDGEIAWQRLMRAVEKKNGMHRKPFDILIADIHLPRLDGLRLMKRCGQAKELRDLSFMIVTGNNDIKYIGAAAELGVAGYVVKPFTFNTFQQTFSQVLVCRKDSGEAALQRIENLIADEAFVDALSFLGELKGCTELPTVRIMTLKARALMGIGRYAESEKCLETVFSSCGRHIFPLKAYAALKLKLGKQQEAMDALEQLVGINPFDTDRNITLGKLYLAHGRRKEGVTILTETAKRQINHEKRIEITDILQKNEFFDEALDIHARNVGQTRLSVQAAESCNKVGIKLRKRGKFAQAERFYKLILNYYPRSTEILFNIGMLYLAWNNRESEACGYFSRALEIDPTFEPARDIYMKHFDRAM